MSKVCRRFEGSPHEKMSKKEEILKTASKMFLTNGYDNTSIEDITRSCGITKGAFYYHFKSKEEIFLRIASLILEEMKTWFTRKTDSARSAEDLVKAFFNLSDYFSYSQFYDNMKSHLYYALLDIDRLYPELRKTFSESLFSIIPEMAEIIEQSQRKEEIRQTHDPEALAFLIIYAMEGLLFVSAISGEESLLAERGRLIGENLWLSINT